VTVRSDLLPAVKRAVQALSLPPRRLLASAPPHWQNQKLTLLHEIDIFRDLTREELEWVKGSTRIGRKQIVLKDGPGLEALANRTNSQPGR
jgi:hypothetical protein